MKKLLLWFWLLTKRLYKKPTFVAILLLIPLLVLGYSAAAQEDSGILTVALAQTGSDPLASEILEDLDSSGQLLRFVRCKTPEEAEALVRGGKADTAWIFPDGMEEKLQVFAADPVAENAIVTVLVREDNVALKLSREKLSDALYAHCSPLVSRAYVRQNLPELAQLSDETLLSYYEDAFGGQELFAFEEADSSVAAPPSHYLTAPLRGLLAHTILLCGLATAMYYMDDTRRGTFAWLSQRRRPLAELGCQMVSLLNVTAVALVALALAKLTGGFLRELLVAVLYCISVAAFCMLLRRLCGSIRLLGTLLPLLVVLMLVICPVFFDIEFLRPLQLLLPPSYFISAPYNDLHLLLLPIHAAACFALYTLLGIAHRD